MMRTGGWLRFALEVAFIVMVAAGAAAARLSPVGIAAALGGAFLLAGLVEYMGPRWGSWRLGQRPDLRRRTSQPERRASRDTPVVRPTAQPRPPFDIRIERPPPPTFTPAEPAPAGGPAAAAAAKGQAPAGRPRPIVPPPPPRPPVAAPPPPPPTVPATPPGQGEARDQPLGPIPSQSPGPPPEPAERPVPEPAPRPAPLALPPAPPAPPPAPAREPEPPPPPPPPPAPAPPPPVAAPPPPPAAPPPPPAAPAAPFRWNVFELESRVRAVAGRNPDRDEEWRYMLLHLREHASADGTLPPSFDGLIRESFHELVPAGR